MPHGLLSWLVLAAALGCGLMAGVFFAFSSFVMPALGRLPAPRAIAAMQAMNVSAVTPAFMTLFLGTAVLCAAAGVAGLLLRGGPGSALLLAGSLLYLGGGVGVTAAYNVPRNDALAPLDPDAEESAGHWRRYLAEWTRWNHLRTVASTAAAAAFTVSLLGAG
jgi:uncharacterized membrane protein